MAQPIFSQSFYHVKRSIESWATMYCSYKVLIVNNQSICGNLPYQVTLHRMSSFSDCKISIAFQSRVGSKQ
jgi:hypothetical protein